MTAKRASLSICVVITDDHGLDLSRYFSMKFRLDPFLVWCLMTKFSPVLKKINNKEHQKFRQQKT